MIGSLLKTSASVLDAAVWAVRGDIGSGSHCVTKGRDKEWNRELLSLLDQLLSDAEKGSVLSPDGERWPRLVKSGRSV